MSKVFTEIKNLLLTQLLERWNSTSDQAESAHLVLAAEALGAVEHLADGGDRLSEGNSLVIAHARDVLLLPHPHALETIPDSSINDDCAVLILNTAPLAEDTLSRLEIKLQQQAALGTAAAIGCLPAFTWLKVPLPESFPSIEALLSSELCHDSRFINALYHLGLLEEEGLDPLRPVFESCLDGLLSFIETIKTASDLHEAALQFNLLSEILGDQPATSSVRRVVGPGFRDLLHFLDTQGMATSKPWSKLDSEEPPVLELSYQGPVISVLVPVFNSVATLSETLASLRRQHYKHWQAIIVDGPSSDGTRELASAWAAYDNRIQVHEQRSKGLAAARNEALERATGELVHCLDGDDLLEPNFYAIMVAKLQSFKPLVPGRCVVSSVRKFSGVHDAFLYWPAPAVEQSFFKALAAGENIPVHAVLFDRHLLKYSGPFDGELSCCEDWDLWMRFARLKAIFVPVPQACAWYRILDTSLSRNYVPYIDTFKRVGLRASVPDARCATDGPQEDPVELALVQKGLLLFWLENIRRSSCQLDEETTQALMKWAGAELPQSFWLNPELFHRNFKFRKVDVGGDEKSDNWELQARLIYLKAFSLWWPKRSLKHLVHAHIEGILYACKTGKADEQLKADTLRELCTQPLRNYLGLKLRWHSLRLLKQISDAL